MDSRQKFNHHPAPYPVALAEWIIRLLCPMGGTVIDPFLGSGSTAKAAKKPGAGSSGATSTRIMSKSRNEGWLHRSISRAGQDSRRLHSAS